MAKPLRFRVVPQEDGMKLIQLLVRRMPGTSADTARNLVRGGSVYMGHLRIRVPTVRVAPGDRITVHAAAAAAHSLPPEMLKFVYRDDDFVVLDKPAGVPVAATRETARGTLAEALRNSLQAQGVVRPYVGILHRLDQGASGLVAMTIRGVTNTSLHRQFVEHEIRRIYRVVVRGDTQAQMECALPILELHSGTSKPAADNPRARPAHTMFTRRIARHPVPDSTLLDVELETGRHHQIRVHAQALGHPVVGDHRYGSDDGADRLLLHAHRLQLTHPRTGEPCEFVSECPPWAQAVDDAQ